MSTYLLGYRLTLYAPRSVDSTEATVLTPPGGAVHNDPFQVTTLQGLSGWKPYLGVPVGRTSRLNLLERTSDVGSMSFDLLDTALVPGINANRWVTAFLGNALGDPQLGGLRCKVEETLDGGVNWSAYWAGYTKALALNGQGQYQLTVRDYFWDLMRLPLFKTPPHSSITYCGRPLLLPIGISGTYAQATTVPDLTGTLKSPVTVGGSTLANVAQVLCDGASNNRKENFVTMNLIRAAAPNRLGDDQAVAGLPDFTAGLCRAHLTWNAGANQGDFRVGGLSLYGHGGLMNPYGANRHSLVTAVFIAPLEDTTDLNYSALPANGTAVSFRLFVDGRLEEGNSLLVEVANPLTMLQDILAGKFSPLYRYPDQRPPGKAYGDVRRSFANTVSAASVPDLPPARFVINKGEDNALDWITKNILKPYGLVLVQDGSGSFSVVDLRLPQTLAGVPTLTDADVVASTAPQWTYDREQAMFRAEGTLWEDQPLQIDALLASSDAWPEMDKMLLNSVDHAVVMLAIGSGDFGEKTWTMGGEGYRVMSGDALVQNRTRGAYLRQRIIDQLNLIRRPYAHGETIAVLPCRRTATVVALTQGQVVQLAVSALPDPATGKRGTTRVARLLESTRNGVDVNLRLLDLSTAGVAVVPAVGAPALGSDPRHTATVLVTLNGSAQPAEVRFALTNGGTVPADTSPAWHAYPSNPVLATATLLLTSLTPGMRLWVQARTMPNDRTALQLPSVWVTSASLDLTAYAAPTTLVVSPITGQSAKVGWTNTATDLSIEVLLASPTTDPLVRVATLLPGSTFFNLWGLVASTQYKVQVQYRSHDGLVSGAINTTFTTTSGLTVLPRPPIFGRVLL